MCLPWHIHVCNIETKVVLVLFAFKVFCSYPAVTSSIFIYPIVFQKHAKGQDLFDQIVYHLDLVETDYFGLQFLDSSQVTVSTPLIRFGTG